MAWVIGPGGVARWDGEPFPEPHDDVLRAYGYNQGPPPRRFLAHRVAVAYAAQRALRSGVRQRVERRGGVWRVLPVTHPAAVAS